MVVGESGVRWWGPSLFRRPSIPLNPWQLIGWWELRRIPYNLIVGVTGLATVTIMVAVGLICNSRIGVPIGIPDPPIFALLGIAVFAIMANVCFTGGWVVELLLVQAGGLRSSRFGEIAFKLGLLGSVLLTLLPAAVTIAVAVATLEGWIPVPSESACWSGVDSAAG